MAVTLRPMTAEEYVPFEEAGARRYADLMVRAGFWPAESALERSHALHTKLLPQGVETPDVLLLLVETPGAAGPIGHLWLSISREATPPTGFIYDVFLAEPYRGQGLGRQAMQALEERAREMGLARLSLHVFADNAPARGLYQALGYEVKSLNMSKTLAPGDEPAAV
jgi:ribosomal protein S18 acetylase RimI-like enzyme